MYILYIYYNTNSGTKKSKSALFKTNLDCFQSFEIIDVYKSREVDANTKKTVLRQFNYAFKAAFASSQSLVKPSAS